MSNIRAVSRLAGVSVATVSRAFSAPDKVADKTLVKVRAAARQLNYKPNSQARILRSNNKTNTVVVVVPDLANSFFSKVLSGLESVATETGMALLLADSHDNRAIERSCIDMVQTRRADGIIQLGSRSIEALANGEATRDIPFVHAIEPPASTASPGYCIDNAAASEQMVDFIQSQGHKVIGVVAGQEISEITHRRLEGYRSSINKSGIPYRAEMVEFGTYTVKGGAEATARLLTRHPEITALFCMSDDIAIGAMKAARARGLTLPDDLSISGFDNIEIGEYIEPSLTTVTQPARRIGELAMRMMVDVMAGHPVPPGRQILPADLVIRNSIKRRD